MSYVILGDTDSAYVHLEPYLKDNGLESTDEVITKIANALEKELVNRLSDKIAPKFCTTPERVSVLKAGREVVARTGLLKDTKKRYALHVIDVEGVKKDDLKIMGFETTRSDTPKFVQDFLKQLLVMLVKEDKGYDELREYVENFRTEFRKRDKWTNGIPCRVSNLTTRTNELLDFNDNRDVIGMKNPLIHYSVKAAMNTNMLINEFDEKNWSPIMDGDKIQVLYLKKNNYGIESVAIKTDEKYIPDWFTILPFDNLLMEEKLIDKKVENIIGVVMDWDFKESLYLDVAKTDIGFY